MGALRALCAAAGLLSVSALEFGVPESRAHLVLTAAVDPVPLVAGRNTTLTVSVYNAGTSAAFEVAVEEAVRGGAEVVGGALKQAFPTVGAGANVTYEVELMLPAAELVTERAALLVGPATLTYKPSSDADAVVEGTTSELQFEIVPVMEYYVSLALRAGSYATLGYVKTVNEWRATGLTTGVASMLAAAVWFVSKMRAGLSDRRRRLALEALEKEQ